MKKTLGLFVLLAVATVAAVSLAQPPGDGPPREPRGDRPGPPHGPPPVMHALDADRDGSLSAEEIAGASEALKTLDKNDDGQLSEDELRPPRPPRGGEDRADDRPRREDGPREGRTFRRDRGPREEGRPDGPGREGRRGPPHDGPRAGLPPIVPPHVRDELDLSEEQAQKLRDLHEEVQNKLKSILSEEQYEKLSHMRPPHPPGGPRGPGRPDRPASPPADQLE